MPRSTAIILALIAIVAVFTAVTTVVSASAVHSTPSHHRQAQTSVVSSRIQTFLRADRHYRQAREHEQKLREVEADRTTVKMNAGMVYNRQVADKLFWHSVTAYCADNPRLKDWTCNSCNEFGNFAITSVMNNGANQGYVGYFTQGLPQSPIDNGRGTTGVKASDPFIIVSFRGTTGDLKDRIEDLKFFKTQPFPNTYPNVQMHRGFLESYQALKSDMMAGIQVALERSRAQTIIFTGHSLGAAMTEIAALDLALNEYPTLNYAVYTQGNPRVGNGAFASLFEQKIAASFREVHNRDVVPHLPPESFGFEHPSDEVWYNEEFSSYKICTDGESNKCSDGLWIHISVDDHIHYRNIDVGTYCTN